MQSFGKEERLFDKCKEFQDRSQRLLNVSFLGKGMEVSYIPHPDITNKNI